MGEIVTSVSGKPMMKHRRCLLAATLLFTSVAGAAAKEYSVAPPPAWVLPAPLELDAPVPDEEINSGVYYLLVDDQTRVSSATEETYYRRAKKVLTTAGVQSSSELDVSFDPTYQKLVFHHIRLLRGAETIEALRAGDIKVIQQESDLSQRIYNGTLTALAFLRDVRPGDVIDYAYSIRGANPILEGKFVGGVRVAYEIPVRVLRSRLLMPPGRKVQIRNYRTSIEPRIERGAETTTYLWEQRDVRALDVDDEIPSWFDPYPAVEMSEFESWGDVARWASAMFSIADPKPGALATLVAEIERKGATPAERALAAVRFVQDDIRYLGIETGLNSHQPHPPSQVLAQRFGDCKDKALLLRTILRATGIAADAALINTTAAHTLDQWLPSPFAFDHVIVRMQLEGKEYWIDATRSEQGGSLEELAVPNYARALLIDAATTALSAIALPLAGEPLTHIEESYTVTRYDAPATLHVRTVYRESDADSMRSFLASTSRSDLAKQYLNHYAGDDPKIEAKRLPEVVDDRVRNEVVVTEEYVLPDFWKNRKRDFFAWAIGDQLRTPRTRLRTMPLAVVHPIHLRQTVVIRLPEPFEVKPESVTISNPAFRFRRRAEAAGTTVKLSYAYQSLKDFVEVSDLKKYLQQIDDTSEELSYQLEHGIQTANAAALAPQGIPRSAAAAKWIAAILIGCVAAAGIAIAFIRLRSSRRKRSFSEQTGAFEPGEAPASAFVVRNAVEMEYRLERMRCRCGSRRCRSHEPQKVRYDDRVLILASRVCADCGAEEAFYFDLIETRNARAEAPGAQPEASAT